MKSFGNAPYKITYLDEVLKDDVPNLPKQALRVIRRAIEERLKIDPISFGKPLQYTLKGYRRLRVGDYRIIYKIEKEKHSILISSIKNRKDAYD